MVGIQRCVRSFERNHRRSSRWKVIQIPLELGVYIYEHVAFATPLAIPIQHSSSIQQGRTA